MTSLMSPGMHPVLAALRVIDTGLDEIGEANLWSLLDSESLEVLRESQRLAARLTSVVLRATREVDIRGAAVGAGATSLTAWLTSVGRIHPGQAAREVRLAAALDQDLPATAAALSAGEISPAAVAVIAEADQELRRFATAAQRADAEALMAGHARTLPVRGLQNAALHLCNSLDPDQGQRLARDEQAQVARREFRLRINPDGSSRPDGYLDKEATAFLRTALDPLATPRPAADGIRDPRTAAQRTGDALLELVELALRSGDLPTQNGQPVQLVVTIDLDDLRRRADAGSQSPFHGHHANRGRASDPGDPFDGFDLTDLGLGGPGGPGGVGMLDTGLPVSADTVRRWACDCLIIPMALGSNSEPLDVGRAARTPPPPMRRALDVRDGGCAFPGCDRPPKWCRSHHIWHWSAGGPTSIGNSVLLCDHHHRVVHHHGRDVRIEPDGLPSFYPPGWIDPDRAPRRNHRHKPQTANRPRDPGGGLAPVLTSAGR